MSLALDNKTFVLFRGLGVAVVLFGLITASTSAMSSTSETRQQYATAWQTFGGLDGGCDGPVWVIRRSPDGDVYLAGDFHTCNGTHSPGLVRYSVAADSFHAVASTLVGGTIRDIAWYQGELVIAGGFLSAPGGAQGAVLRWDGSAWTQLGAGPAGTFDYPVARMLLPMDGGLIAAGDFRDVGGVGAARIARWDGTKWSRLGDGLGLAGDNSQYVAKLAIQDGALVAAGRFSHSGAIGGFGNVARWDGVTWQALGSQEERIQDLIVDGEGRLVSVGIFGFGTGPSLKVNQWTGTAWVPLAPDEDSGFNGEVTALALHDGDLVAGGLFTRFGSDVIHGLARWTGETWVRHPADDDSAPTLVRALLGDGGNLYVSREFNSSSGRGLHQISRLAGSWHRLGVRNGELGLGASVNRLLSNGSLLVATGEVLRAAGEIVTPGVALWRGSGWHRAGTVGTQWNMGLLGPAAIYEAGLYAESYFLDIEGNFLTRFARWSGEDWMPVVDVNGVELLGGSKAMLDHDGELVVAGTLNFSGPWGSVRIARWNGERWAPTVSSSDGTFSPGQEIRSLVEFEGDLIVGGNFSQVVGSPASGLARWNGTTWTPISTGLQVGGVRSMAVWRGDLYVASQGNVRLARLQGNEWQPLVSSPGEIHALAVVRDSLWIGGRFSAIGGIAANGLARFDGETFHPVQGQLLAAPGIALNVLALVEHEGELIVGGNLRSVDGQRSAHIARLLPDVVDGMDMHLRVPVAKADPDAHRVAYRVRLGNRGGAAGVPASFTASAWPQPLAVTWTCEPGAFSSEPCPAGAGTGLPAWTTTMAAGAEFYLDLILDAAPDTTVQRLRLDLSAPPVPGVENRASTGLTVTTAMAEEVLFVDGFESASNR